MHMATALDELTEAELLDHADEVSRRQRECEVNVRIRAVADRNYGQAPGPRTGQARGSRRGPCRVAGRIVDEDPR